MGGMDRHQEWNGASEGPRHPCPTKVSGLEPHGETRNRSLTHHWSSNSPDRGSKGWFGSRSCEIRTVSNGSPRKRVRNAYLPLLDRREMAAAPVRASRMEMDSSRWKTTVALWDDQLPLHGERSHEGPTMALPEVHRKREIKILSINPNTLKPRSECTHSPVCMAVSSRRGTTTATTVRQRACHCCRKRGGRARNAVVDVQ